MNPIAKRLATHRRAILQACAGLLLLALVLSLTAVTAPAHAAPVTVTPATPVTGDARGGPSAGPADSAGSTAPAEGGAGADGTDDAAGTGSADGGGGAGGKSAEPTAEAAAESTDGARDTGEVPDAADHVGLGNLSLATIDAAENPVPGNLVVGTSIALLTFDWKAQEAALTAGDSFSIELPEQLAHKVPGTRPFTAALGEASSTEVGSCTITTTTMTCTFNEVLPARAAAGYTSPHGVGKVQLMPVAPTSRESLDFVVNGAQTHSVDLPGQGGITKNAAEYKPLALAKGARAMNEQSTSVGWVISFGTEKLQAAYASGPEAVAFDGSQRTITLNDVLGPGQSYPDASKWKLVRLNSKDAPDPNAGGRVELDTGAGGPTTTEAGAYSIEVVPGEASEAGSRATIVLRGPFTAETNYQIVYDAKATTEDGRAVAGFVYEGWVSVEGTTLKQHGTKSFLDSFGLDVRMELGYGTFSVAKYVSGPASDQVAPGSTFTVEVDYRLPGGATSKDYPSWQAPGTLNSAGTGGSATLEVAMGQRTLFVGPRAPVTLPKGTTVTLREQAPEAEAPMGYAWSVGSFSLGQVQGSTLTIQDREVTEVDLTNSLEAAAVGTFNVTLEVSPQGGPFASDTFEVGYACTEPGGQVRSGALQVPAGSTVTSSEKFMVGSRCTISNSGASRNREGYTAVTRITANGRTGGHLVIAEDSVGEVAVEHIYTALGKARRADGSSATEGDEAAVGGFQLSKSVAGGGADRAGSVFLFDYTCTHQDGSASTGSVSVETGQAVLVDDVGQGQCTLTERSAPVAGTDLVVGSMVDGSPAEGASATFEVDGVTTVAVEFTNTYSAHSEPEGGRHEPEEGGGAFAAAAEKDRGESVLALTGAAIRIPAAISLAAILAGLIVVRRRQA